MILVLLKANVGAQQKDMWLVYRLTIVIYRLVRLAG